MVVSIMLNEKFFVVGLGGEEGNFHEAKLSILYLQMFEDNNPEPLISNIYEQEI